MKNEFLKIAAMMGVNRSDFGGYNMRKNVALRKIYFPEHSGSKPIYGELYTYEDGFECRAMNKKNADRKHCNWLKLNKKL